MKITIVGAGNMGLCLLGYLSYTGNDVTLYTKSDRLNRRDLYLNIVEKGKAHLIDNYKITDSKENAFRDTDLVLCTYPAFLRRDFIKEIEDVLNSDSILCFIPGYGGAEYYCKSLLMRGVTICGFQRVPYVARYDVEGSIAKANILSTKKELFIATIPQSNNAKVAKLIQSLLHIPTVPLKEYLAVTMSPSNPLLHISGLYNVFQNSTAESIFPEMLNFYEEWNDSTSELLIAYDEELHEICNSMKPYFELEEIVPLTEYYESETPRLMTKKLQSIEAFKVVKVPLKPADSEGYIVDLNSRMFKEDFPFGVCMFKSFALMTGVKTPIIDKLLLFYKKLSGKVYFNENGEFGPDVNETGIPQLYGIDTISELKKLYIGK